MPIASVVMGKCKKKKGEGYGIGSNCDFDKNIN